MSNIGANPLKESYMKLSSLGEVYLSVLPQDGNPEIMNVSLMAEHRDEIINGVTKKDETVDQFSLRLKGMLRALMNGVPRSDSPVNLPDTKPEKSWSERKKDMNIQFAIED